MQIIPICEISLPSESIGRFSTHDVEYANKLWFGRVIEFGGLSRSLPDDSATFITTTANIIFADTDRYFSNMPSTWLNRNISISILILYDNAAIQLKRLFTGLITEFEYQNATFTLQTRSKDYFYKNKSFQWYINKTTFPNAPSKFIGKPIPIIYGNVDGTITEQS